MTFVQLSIPVVAVWYSSKVLSFNRLNNDVFPTPSSPSKTTLYVGPLPLYAIFNVSRVVQTGLRYSL